MSYTSWPETTAQWAEKLQARAVVVFCCFIAPSLIKTKFVRLRDRGIREMTFALDNLGSHVVVNDPFIDGDENGGSAWRFVPHARSEGWNWVPRSK